MTHPANREVHSPSAGLGSPTLRTYRGRYTLRRKVEVGGMGILYKGVDHAFGLPVAIKALGPEAPGWIRRCLEREACLGLRLHHPSIVRHLDYFEEGGARFLVMEWLDGQTLAQQLETETISTESALRILSHICRAVDACHAAGVVHLDVKPENVMVLPDGSVKLLDFGLSRSRLHGGNERRWIDGELMGTPHYMAPEVILGSPRRLRPTADVYALGVMLYQILTGTFPHCGASSTDVLLHVVEKEFVAPRWLDPDISPRLEGVCLQALERNPSLRYTSARRFVQDLEWALDTDTGQAPASDSVSRIPSMVFFWRADPPVPGDKANPGTFFFGVRK